MDGRTGMNQGERMEVGGSLVSRKRPLFHEFVETLVLTFLIYVLIRTFLFENYRVVGHSMDPTLEDNQYLMVSKLDYRLHEPQRGDIIVFYDPHDRERKLIKRIVGLPGEILEIRNGQVFVNKRRLEEAYIVNPGHYSQPPIPIPEDSYYVLGDNRNNSNDSHNWGPLSGQEIVGKAWLTYWPPRLWGLIPHQAYGSLP